MKSSRTTIPKKSVAETESIEELAGQILAYLAEDSERLGRFFALTGLEPQNLRRAASQAGFAASVVHYLASDERLLTAFAGERHLDPAALAATAARLDAPLSDADA